jgi:membrane-associated protease RseP (regulator of RpoE activity)
VCIPPWLLLVTLILLLVVHEGMHGIMAAREKVRIKSLGAIFIALLPVGAFMEPDEKQLAKRPAWEQLRVFAAGSFGNFVLSFGVAIVIAPLMFSPFIAVADGLVVSPAAGYPFANSELADITNNFSSELSPAFVIKTINGRQIDNVNAAEVFDSLAIKPGDSVRLNVDVYYGDSFDNIDLEMVAAENPENAPKGYLGILFSQAESSIVRPEFAVYRGAIMFFQEMVFWIILINFFVGAANMLPIGPFDGGKMWMIVFRRIAPSRCTRISSALSWFTFIMLIALIGPALVSNLL